MTKKRILIICFIALIAAAAVLLYFVLKDNFLKERYPLNYEDLIVSNANEYGLDPYFVAAMIDTESGFDATAVSPDGAQGLMQIMPDTAEWIAQKIDATEYDMFDPATNIRFGCWYMSFLTERFSGEQQLIVAAYNAGHNKVEEWLSAGYSSDGVTLDEIPYEETEKYVDKVSKAYEKYKELYEIG